jgi:hypothetical protein
MKSKILLSKMKSKTLLSKTKSKILLSKIKKREKFTKRRRYLSIAIKRPITGSKEKQLKAITLQICINIKITKIVYPSITCCQVTGFKKIIN